MCDRKYAVKAPLKWREATTLSSVFKPLLGLVCLMVVLQSLAVQVTYQVNLSVQIALGNFRPGIDTIFVSGTFTSPNWIASSSASAYLLRPSAGDSNIYTGTFNIINGTGTTEEHKFVINPNNSYSSTTLDWENVTGGGNRTFLVANSNMTLPVVYFSDGTQPTFPFTAAADFSLLSFFENSGIHYKDGGQVRDGLSILKNHAFTCVRLRLFTSSAAQAQADPYNYTNNLTYTVPLAVRVKNAGLQLMIDFHYSDTWADPGHQAIPSAWTNLTFPQLVQQMHDYNSNSIASFIAAGVTPDFVQVGNEITGGMLWPYGEVGGSFNTSNQWFQLGQLMNSAIQGIKEASGAQMPKIVVHIDRGGDWGTTQWFFDNLLTQGVPFDIIGESYYPFWHGPLSALSNCLTNAAKRYSKPVFVAETAFPWTNSFWTNNTIVGFTPSPTGQVQYAVALAQIVKSVPSRMGAGVFYWGSEYQKVNGVNEAGFNTASFFDAGGNFLPGGNTFGQMAAPLWLTAALNGTALQLNWPLSGAGASLLTTTSMTSASWLPVTNAVQNTGGVFNLTLPIDSTQSRFYRLRSN
jgi:arabinogalactan endo-1,4-beta-galactosidase